MQQQPYSAIKIPTRMTGDRDGYGRVEEREVEREDYIMSEKIYIFHKGY